MPAVSCAESSDHWLSWSPAQCHGTCLRPRVVGAAEGKSVYAVLGQECMIGADILPGVKVVRFQPALPVVQLGVVVKQELPAIGLEAFHAHVQQVLALVKPPLHRLGVGEVPIGGYGGTSFP